MSILLSSIFFRRPTVFLNGYQNKRFKERAGVEELTAGGGFTALGGGKSHPGGSLLKAEIEA
jgi:hypothetical protein